MSNHTALQRYEELKTEADRRRQVRQQTPGATVRIGMATCGVAAGALETKATFQQEITARGLQARIETVGCNGHCYAEPCVIIDHPDSGFPPIMYPEVSPGKASMLVKLFLEGFDPRLEHILGATVENDMIPAVMDFPRFHLEKRVITEMCGKIDPEDIYDYIAEGGYAALAQCLQEPPDSIIAGVTASGLRGRGGAGYPTGKKWELARGAAGSEKFAICNADEGDPGAYMDRTLLESNPHQVLEGLIICAYAVGASKALIYVRSEYPLAVQTLRTAIGQATEAGILGSSVMGSDTGVTIEVFEGSGAFVCGEETALIRSIEGHRGMPLHRPPYPAHVGLWGRPTVINNVKTLATVPAIISRGADWFRQIGTAHSPGTAIFSVVGDVTHPGLVEIPMGITLRNLIFDICGGIPGKKAFKAVQIGGPSGGCLPEAFLDTPIDFDSLIQAGAMMGSGGIVVMDEENCMVDVSRYFLEFTQKESCGKCTFCRIGTFHLLHILERLTTGSGRAEDLDLLQTLSEDIQAGSLCGLGKTAPNPVVTSLRYFTEDYRAHVEEKRCPGLTCRALMTYYIDLEKCAVGCEACVGVCPVDAIFTTSNRKKGIDQEKCVKCGECRVVCPPEYDAVERISPPDLAPLVERPTEADKKN